MPQLERSHEVFVSSTFRDLRDERQVVLQTLLSFKCLPSGMELFPNGDPDVWDLIKRQIERCDLYVLVVGSRYGSRRKGATLSFTHEEYLHALEHKKKILVFPIDSPELRKPEMWNDQSPEDQIALKEFAAQVAARSTRPWGDVNQLRNSLTIDLAQHLHEVPAGWTRVSADVISAFDQDIKALEARFDSGEIQRLTKTLQSTLQQFQFQRVKERIDSLGEILPWLSKREWEYLRDFARAQAMVRMMPTTAPDDPMKRSIVDLVAHYQDQLRDVESGVIEVHGDQLINAVSGYFVGAVQHSFRALSNDDFRFWRTKESAQYYKHTLNLLKNKRNVERTFVIPQEHFTHPKVQEVLRRQIKDEVKVRIISSQDLARLVTSRFDRDFGLHDNFAVSFFRNYLGRSYKVDIRRSRVDEFVKRFAQVSDNAEVIPGKADGDERLFTSVDHFDAWVDGVRSAPRLLQKDEEWDDEMADA